MMESDFRNQIAETLQEGSKGHVREGNVTYYQMPVLDDLATKEKWKGLKTIGVAIRISEHGDKGSSGVRYYISSLPLNVKNFSKYVRGHWAIENTLHWCLDATFRED